MGARPAHPALQPRQARRIPGGGGVREGSRRETRGRGARQAPDEGVRHLRVPGEGAGLAEGRVGETPRRRRGPGHLAGAPRRRPDRDGPHEDDAGVSRIKHRGHVASSGQVRSPPAGRFEGRPSSLPDVPSVGVAGGRVQRGCRLFTEQGPRRARPGVARVDGRGSGVARGGYHRAERVSQAVARRAALVHRGRWSGRRRSSTWRGGRGRLVEPSRARAGGPAVRVRASIDRGCRPIPQPA